jgi:hypothetical protein
VVHCTSRDDAELPLAETPLTTGIGSLTEILNDLEVLPLSLLREIVKLAVADAVGVPEMAPVDGSRISPAGSDPVETLQIGLEQLPVVAIKCAYPNPFTPLSKTAVLIAQALSGTNVNATRA